MSESPNWEPRRRARRRALQALYQWQITGVASGPIIAQFIDTQDFAGVDEEYFRNLVAGVIAEQELLGEALVPCLDRPLAQCDVMERVILLMGAMQFLREPEMPVAVVIDEAVDLAGRFGSAQSGVFVNGVLDAAGKALRRATPEA